MIQIGDRIPDKQDVIMNIAQIRTDLGGFDSEVVAAQLIADFDHRRDCMAHIEQSGAQTIDTLDFFRSPASSRKYRPRSLPVPQ